MTKPLDPKVKAARAKAREEERARIREEKEVERAERRRKELSERKNQKKDRPPFPECIKLEKWPPAPVLNVNEWQYIETAPKDGSDILLYEKSSCFPEVWVGHYTIYNDEPTWTDGDDSLVNTNPTHWMSIPKPPNNKYKIEKKEDE